MNGSPPTSPPLQGWVADGTDGQLNDPQPLSAVDPSAYDAVVFPGGHGTVWDVDQDHHAQAALRTAVAGEDGVALVVCHAVGLLTFTPDADGEFLVDGGLITARGPPSSAAAAETLLAELDS